MKGDGEEKWRWEWWGEDEREMERKRKRGEREFLQVCILTRCSGTIALLAEDSFLTFCVSPPSCSPSLKRVQLELGGKSPLIIFSDCDMDRAVRQVRED